MTARMLELISSKQEQLFPGSRQANAAEMQKNAWEEVTNTLNMEFPPGGLTVAQVRTRFKNIRQTGKEDFQKQKKWILGNGMDDKWV